MNLLRHAALLAAVVLSGCASLPVDAATAPLKIALFEADVTPPLGAPLCGGSVKPAEAINDPLAARGIVLLSPTAPPVVLCTVEWVGIGGGSHDAWRQALADAAGTTFDRVAVHATHPHDAPWANESVEGLLAANGLSGTMFDPVAARAAIAQAAAALSAALPAARAITHVGHGAAAVHEVASNRRILGPDGKVRVTRWTATPDPAVRAEPEGLIDPIARAVSFWDGDAPVAALTYYTTHPQSKYGLGRVSADFVGDARDLAEAALGVPVLHFNGASGNVGAGKYNDGNPANRPVLAGRLFDGLKAAWDATARRPITPADTEWTSLAVDLPLRDDIDEDFERAMLTDPKADRGLRVNAAVELAWRERCQDGKKTDLHLLRLGDIHILHMPGELFVEYQLAAQAMRPDAPVAMAAYGNYAMGYIGTRAAYPQGGYETARYVSRTAPEVEDILMDAMRALLVPPNTP